MKKVLKSLLTIVMVIGLMTGCNNSEEPNTETQDMEGDSENEVDQDKKEFKVAVIIAGSLGDGGFNDMAANGVERASEDFGIDYQIIEIPSSDKTKFEPTLIDTSEEEEYDLITVAGNAWKEVLQKVAPLYPEQKYYIYDASLDPEQGDFSNVYSNTFKQNEAAFLGGVVAANMTQATNLENLNEDNTVGLVLMMDMAVINDFAVGFIEGTQYVNPDTTVNTAYIGSVDAAKAKDIAKAQYQQGADIVFQVAASAGLGVMEAAVEENAYMIGVDQDQSETYKENFPEGAETILTSVIKRVDEIVYQTIKRLYEGDEIAWGETEALGLEEQAVGIAKSAQYQEMVDENTKEMVEEVEQKIINGEITVSTAFGMSPDDLQSLRDGVKP